MGNTSFNITVTTKNPKVLEYLSQALKDLTPVFEKTVENWTEHNTDKFNLAQGAEFPGVSFSGEGVMWKGVTEQYEQEKRKKGYTDWLMVRTGETRDVLTDTARFFSQISPTQAVFPMIDDEDVMDKIRYNWDTRQTIFLDITDKRMIQKEVQQFLNESLAKGVNEEVTEEIGESGG